MREEWISERGEDEEEGLMMMEERERREEEGRRREKRECIRVVLQGDPIDPI